MQGLSTSSSVPINDKSFIPSNPRFPVVGLGASAGGLQAPNRFLENMPPDAGMAFVVVLHLSPSHERSAAQVLQGATSMPVRQVNEPALIEKNRVYVIPLNKQLSINDSCLVDDGSGTRHERKRGGSAAGYVAGEPSHNLVSVVLPELRLELRTALFQAFNKGKSAEARRVRIRRGDHASWVNMVVRPFHDEQAGSEFVLVLFRLRATG